MEYYSLVKHIHMTSAVISLLGFVVRGYWMATENPLLQHKPVKILPHVVDTLLLSTAIYLVIVLQLYPFVVGWVTAKLILLIAYIGVGTIALKKGKSKPVRLVALIVAVGMILAIFAIASIKPSFG